MVVTRGRRRGRVAIVTGGGSGIGAALVKRLAAEGATTVVADLDRARAEAVASEVREAGGAARAVRLDVTDAQSFRDVRDELLATEGRIDELFNNAGIGLAGLVEDLTLADWRRIIDVNLWGVIHGIDAFYPTLVAQRSGTIVNTASGAGLSPRPGMTPYAAAKHAVVGLSTSLRAEAAAHGVQVSVLCPGYVKTNIVEASASVKVDARAMVAAVPIAPMSADDCAAATLTGVAKNRAVIVPGTTAWLEWLAFRVSPGVSMSIAKLRASKFRASRDAALRRPS